MEMANPDKSIIDPSWQLSQIDPKLTLTGLAGSEAALYRSTAARPVSGDRHWTPATGNHLIIIFIYRDKFLPILPPIIRLIRSN